MICCALPCEEGFFGFGYENKKQIMICAERFLASLEMTPLSVYRGGVVRTRPHNPLFLVANARHSDRREESQKARHTQLSLVPKGDIC